MKKGTFRKIVALGTGLTMLGATVFGATAAADLSQYPDPLFIQDGKFNGNIVVGKLADMDDMLGAIEVAASLQTAAVKKVPVPGAGGQTATVDKENVKIRQTGREFTLNSTIRDVFGAPIDFSDLPTLLKTNSFDDQKGTNKNKQTYQQQLDFNSDTGRFEFTKTDGAYDEMADEYLWFQKTSSKFAYIYTLDFNTAVTYDNTSTTTAGEDLENNVIEIQGNKYTITDVTVSSGKINKMELLAGETVVWMSQGEPLTRTIDGTEHTITLSDVNEGEDKCGITVDGTTTWVDKSSTEIINGVQIGVTDAIVVHSAGKDTDVCEVNVGATKVTLEENKKVKNNDIEVKGSNAQFKFDGGNYGKWDGFNITLVPSDKVFLKAGDKYVDPVLSNFQFDFAGVNKVTEELSWSRSGRDAELNFVNYDGKDVRVEWEYDSTANQTFLGQDNDTRLLMEGDVFDAGSTQDDAEGHQLFMITSGNVVHILEIADIDTSETPDKIDLDDITYGVTYEDKDITLGTVQSIELGSLGSIQLNITSTGIITATDIELSGVAYTKNKHTVELQKGETMTNNAYYHHPDFNVTEKTDTLDGRNVANTAQWLVYANVDETDDEFDWKDPSVNGFWSSSVIQKSRSDKDTKLKATEFGTIAEWDGKDWTGGTMMLPEEQSYANAFVSKVGAVVSTGAGASALEFQQIQVGTAKLDTAITDVAAQNLLVMGGPCANSVAATLMGNPANCAEGFVEGEAMIRLFSQSNGNVAMLVAGSSAMDTRRASKVVSNYRDYKDSLMGDEVKVKGTTLSDITVSSVA